MQTHTDTQGIPRVAGTEAVDPDTDVASPLGEPYERVFEEAMARIAALHQSWVDSVAEPGDRTSASQPTACSPAAQRDE